jgi:hypothetical protein
MMVFAGSAGIVNIDDERLPVCSISRRRDGVPRQNGRPPLSVRDTVVTQGASGVCAPIGDMAHCLRGDA